MLWVSTATQKIFLFSNPASLAKNLVCFMWLSRWKIQFRSNFKRFAEDSRFSRYYFNLTISTNNIGTKTILTAIYYYQSFSMGRVFSGSKAFPHLFNLLLLKKTVFFIKVIIYSVLLFIYPVFVAFSLNNTILRHVYVSTVNSDIISFAFLYTCWICSDNSDQFSINCSEYLLGFNKILLTPEVWNFLIGW